MILGAVAAGLGVLHIASGVGILRRASWGRVTGVVGVVLGVLMTAVSFVWSLQPAAMVDPFAGQAMAPLTGTGVVLYLLGDVLTVAAYLFVLVVLIRRGTEFEGRSRS